MIIVPTTGDLGCAVKAIKDEFTRTDKRREIDGEMPRLILDGLIRDCGASVMVPKVPKYQPHARLFMLSCYVMTERADYPLQQLVGSVEGCDRFVRTRLHKFEATRPLTRDWPINPSVPHVLKV